MTKFTAAILNETSDSIHANVKNVGKEIQSHLINLMKYAASKRDVDPLTRFVKPLMNEKAIGDKTSKFPIVRTNQIMMWIERYAFATWGTRKSKGKNGKKVTGFALNKTALDSLDAAGRLAHIVAASKVKWNEMSAEPKFVGLDLDKRIASLVKSVEEKLAEIANDTTLTEKQKESVKVDSAKLATLRTLMAA